MSANTRQTRAHSLREFLLSQAVADQLDGGILREALAIIKLPAEKRNVTQLVLVQLLEEWRAGTIGKAEFLVAWRRIVEQSQGEAAVKGGSVESWVLVLVLLALALSAISSWIAYEIGLSSQPETLAVQIAPPPETPVAQIEQPSEIPVTQIKQQPKTPVTQAAQPPEPPIVQVAPPPETPYQDTYIREYVSESFVLASMAETAVTEYYQAMGTGYPGSNAQAGLPQPSDIRGNAVSSVTVGEGGVITVRYNQFVGEGQTLILEPTSSGGGPIVWECKKGTVPARYRPPHCR